MFAGFPYKSRTAPVKLNKICKAWHGTHWPQPEAFSRFAPDLDARLGCASVCQVVCWWTLGRIVWGIVVLTTILQVGRWP